MLCVYDVHMYVYILQLYIILHVRVPHTFMNDSRANGTTALLYSSFTKIPLSTCKYMYRLVVSNVTRSRPPPGPNRNNFGTKPRYNPTIPSHRPIFMTVGIVHGTDVSKVPAVEEVEDIETVFCIRLFATSMGVEKHAPREPPIVPAIKFRTSQFVLNSS